MSNVVKAKVKRYSKKIKNRSKNAKEPYRITETVNIGLSKSCTFKDEEDVYVLDEDTYEKLNNTSDILKEKDDILKEKDNNIHDLETKINELEIKLKDYEEIKVNTPPPKQEDSSEKITIINLMQEINERNQQLYQVDRNINKAIDMVINSTITAAQESFKDSVNSIIKNIVLDNERAVDLRNEKIANFIKESTDKVNNEMNSMNIIKLIRTYRNFNFDISTEEIEKPVRFEVDISPIENLNLNVDTTNIKKNLELEDLSKLWIETNLDDINDARLIESDDFNSNNE